MLRPKRRTALVASAAVFASLFAVLGLVKVSQLVGIPSFITFRESISPLLGMLFGPATGGAAVILGVFMDFGLGNPVVFLGLDFLIDLAAATTAGLAFTGRRKLAVAFPSALIGVFLVSPSSAWLVDVGGVQFPFVWMHVASVLVLGAALRLEAGGRVGRTGWAFVGAVVFASTMAGHITGGILTQYVYLSRGVLFGSQTVGAYWSAVSVLYPVERVFITAVGTAIAVPTLRALERRKAARVTAS